MRHSPRDWFMAAAGATLVLFGVLAVAWVAGQTRDDGFTLRFATVGAVALTWLCVGQAWMLYRASIVVKDVGEELRHTLNRMETGWGASE